LYQIDWPTTSTVFWSVCALLIGLGIFVVCLRLGGLIKRFHKTLDVIEEQIPALTDPVATTLTHVGGIADTADATIARLGAAVAQLETVAENATKTANQVGTIVNNVAASMKK
jgi:ABC-type transporter Mla subunit MlaD